MWRIFSNPDPHRAEIFGNPKYFDSQDPKTLNRMQ
jgi:hypothetical protein